MSEENKREFTEAAGQFWLWAGGLLPPIAWAMQLQTVYLLSEYACTTGDLVPNHAASAAALAISLAGGLISWRNWSRAGARWPGHEATVADRSRFMAALGLLSAALFTATIVAQWLPTITGVPCGI